MSPADVILALLIQRVVRGDHELAVALVKAGQLVAMSAGELLIRQEEDSTAIFFLLHGSVRIEVNGRVVAARTACETVGEMAAIDPRALRAATVVVLESGFALRVSEPALAEVGARYPNLWRQLAAELAERLRESNRARRSPNPTPVVLIRASEAAMADALEKALGSEPALCRRWVEDLSSEQWHAAVGEADFAVAMEGPRGRLADRELWLGFCAGLLGRGRAFLLASPEDQRPCPCCNRLPWAPPDDLGAPAAALLAAILDLGPR